jgi:glycosyltransferase involved in cell wall biosynthesis
MHIVHLLPELKQGGVETVVLGLNRELVRAGHTSTVISAGGQLVEQIIDEGGRHLQLDVCSKNPFTTPLRVRALRHALCTMPTAPDIIHAHSRVPAWLSFLANRKLKIPFVTTVHGFNSINKYSEIMTKGDRVICVSNPVKAYITSNYPVDESLIRIVHGGIDPGKFDPLMPEQSAINKITNRFQLKGKTVVSSIGRITELKDYETFIRAIGKAASNNLDIRGLIVGHVREDKQDYFNTLHQLINDLNLNEVIHIATDLTDMPAVYAVSDLVVSCSKKPESFGLTLIEALAMNTPVAATKHGGPLDIIREGENGFFFEPGYTDELARIIENAKISRQTDYRTATLERFSLDRMISEHVKIYDDLKRTH